MSGSTNCYLIETTTYFEFFLFPGSGDQFMYRSYEPKDVWYWRSIQVIEVDIELGSTSIYTYSRQGSVPGADQGR